MECGSEYPNNMVTSNCYIYTMVHTHPYIVQYNLNRRANYWNYETTHQRLTSFLYIIYLGLRNSFHIRDILHKSRRTVNVRLLPYYPSAHSSGIRIEHLIEITSMTWKLNLRIRKHSSLRSLGSIRTRMWPWSPDWW